MRGKLNEKFYALFIVILLSLVGCGGGKSNHDSNTSTQRKTNLTLSWQANTDADLKGYHIYHGSSPSLLTEEDFVGKDETSYSYQVKSNDSTDHYFSIAAVDHAGNESTHSAVVYVSDKITP